MPPRRTTLAARVPLDAAEQAALRFLARRDRTEAQLRGFLERKGISPPRIQRVIAGFLARGYLDDAEYAVRWGKARLARCPMGTEELRAELRHQGVERATVDRALPQILGERTENDLAREWLARRSRARKPKSRAHAAALLRRHGFSEETIETVLQT